MPCIAGFLVLIIALFLLVIVAVAIVTALGALGIGGASAFAVTKYKKRQFELAAKEVNKNLLPSQPQTASKEKVITPSRKYPVESKVQNPPKQPSKKEAYKWMEQD